MDETYDYVILGGNINAPVMMIAAKAADPIRGRAGLAPVNPPDARASEC